MGAAVTLTLGERLNIRAMTHIAARPIPFFWPLRAFIHHNPLYGLQDMPFADALKTGARLFRGRVFLPRRVYQDYLGRGEVDRAALEAAVTEFSRGVAAPRGVDIKQWLLALLCETRRPFTASSDFARPVDVHMALGGKRPGAAAAADARDVRPRLADELRAALLRGRPIYEAVDILSGTDIGDALDERMIRICLGFFDEGQSAWAMPRRERGFFAASRELAWRGRPGRRWRGSRSEQGLQAADTPEDVIAYVMRRLGVPRQQWPQYFTAELSRLHGWAGFIRWRAGARRYYWARRHPADLVDFLAVRLGVAHTLLQNAECGRFAPTAAGIESAIETNTAEMYLRRELHGKRVLPAMAGAVARALNGGKHSGDLRRIDKTLRDYIAAKRDWEAVAQADRFNALAALVGDAAAARRFSVDDIARMRDIIARFEAREGMLWLRAMEEKMIDKLLRGVPDLSDPAAAAEEDGEAPTHRPAHRPAHRPFAQAMFCIDTRSERIRRRLEQVGDYQTFGIAGFFGVPVSLLPHGKGGETHLCPALVTPKNLVPEIAAAPRDEAVMATLEKAVRGLKKSALAPFVAVEAAGLLFGFNLVGKTIAPRTYIRWRRRARRQKPPTRLIVDKLERRQADSIVRAAQRAVIENALAREFGAQPEKITDDIVRDLREAALESGRKAGVFARAMKLGQAQTEGFVERLRGAYRVNRDFSDAQIERLGRIGFTEDEQINYVSTALRTVGLVENFSRFVLLVGHGSASENNPYESALDCGACGGNHGLASARVLAQMANKPQTRRRLKEQGIDIPDDTWFIPASHNTTTDNIRLHDLGPIPPSHLVYIDRLKNGLVAAGRLCARERVPELDAAENHGRGRAMRAGQAAAAARRNAADWSQVRPEWGLSGNTWFIIGRRRLTKAMALNGRAFLHSYDYRLDPRRRLLENILTGPLVVAQWINMEHYFSTVDNDRFGSGSKVYHNVAGRFAVMSGNFSDLRTGLPAQTVLKNGMPYHKPTRLITLIEAPIAHAKQAIEGVVAVKKLVHNGWLRMLVIDPADRAVSVFADGQWREAALPDYLSTHSTQEPSA